MRRWIETIDDLLAGLHARLFGEKPSPFVKNFTHNLFYSYLGSFGSSFVTFAFFVWAIRRLGPGEFGKMNLVVGTAELLSIPTVLGLPHAAVRYIAAHHGEEKTRKSILGSLWTLLVGLNVLFLPLLAAFARPISRLIRIDVELYYWVLGYGVVLGVYYLVQAILRGLNAFKLRASLYVVSAVMFVGSVIYLIKGLGDTRYTALVISNGLRWTAFVALAALFVPARAGLPSLGWARQIMTYGAYTTVGNVSYFFCQGSLDNLMLNYYLGSEAVGNYSAYYLAFNFVATRLVTIFVEVFFPAISMLKKTTRLVDKLTVLAKIGSAPLILLNLALLWVLFKFYGRQYSFDWSIGALMAVSITLHIFANLAGSVVASRGIPGSRYGAPNLMATAAINVGLNAVLIPIWKIPGTIVATIISSSFLLWRYTRPIRERRFG